MSKHKLIGVIAIPEIDTPELHTGIKKHIDMILLDPNEGMPYLASPNLLRNDGGKLYIRNEREDLSVKKLYDLLYSPNFREPFWDVEIDIDEEVICQDRETFYRANIRDFLRDQVKVHAAIWSVMNEFRKAE